MTRVGHPDIRVRALRPEDAAEFRALRLRALAEEPTAFAASHEKRRRCPCPT